MDTKRFIIAKISNELLNRIYAKLKEQKNAAKALKSIEEDITIADRLGKRTKR